MTGADTPALEISGLRKCYGPVTAVDDISFTVPRGSTTALLGGNGAGKTTTIAMVLGLVTPTAGSLHALGYDLETERRQANALMNFESPYVDMPMRLTVRENLTVYARLYGLSHVRERVRAIADDLALTEFLRKEPLTRIGNLGHASEGTFDTDPNLDTEPHSIFLIMPA